jgi:hypothetical protein
MKPFAPMGSANILEPERSSSAFVLREANERAGLALVLTGAFTVFWYTVVLLTFSSSGWQIIFSLIMTLFGLLPLLLFVTSFQFWQRRRSLESAELKLKSWPVVRGQMLELNFSRHLKGNARVPNAGTLEWRIACSEVTRTDIGTDTTIAHQVLWSLELPVHAIGTGASSLEANASLTLPETLPATFKSDVTIGDGPNRFTKRKTSHWIEWQVHIGTEIKGFDAPESKFALRVQ